MGNAFTNIEPFSNVSNDSQDQLDKLIQTPNSFWGPHRCESCNTVYLSCSHCCLKCGKIFQFHEKKMLWNDHKVCKQLFIKALHLPDIETSHLNPLQPVAVSSIPDQPLSKPSTQPPQQKQQQQPQQIQPTQTIFEPFSNNSNNTTVNANQPISTSSAVSLTDFDLNLFGEVQPTKTTAKKQQANSGLSDFDNFLLGFDSATPQGEPSTNSMAAINEQIAKSAKQTNKKEPIDIDSMQQNNKKLMEIINKIPDLTFMSSKILVVPTSKYNFGDVSVGSPKTSM